MEFVAREAVYVSSSILDEHGIEDCDTRRPHSAKDGVPIRVINDVLH